MARRKAPTGDLRGTVTTEAGDTGSYVISDGWLEVHCEQGTKRARLSDVPGDRVKYAEGLAKILMAELARRGA